MRRAWPAARITLVGLPWASSFVARFAQYLDGFQEFPGFDGIPERGFDSFRMKSFAARSKTLDVAIQLHGNGSVTNRFLPELRARLTAGFFPPGESCPDPARFIPYQDGEHEIRRLLKLMEHLGIPSAGEDLEFPLTHSDYHEAQQIAAAGGLRSGHFACLHAGARDPKRRWPIDNFVQVAEALVARGLRVVLTGTSDEADQAAVLRSRLGDSCLDLTGKTSLGGLGALLKKARLLVANDTGISHLAAALQVPSIVIFSASDPRRWAPLDTARHRALGDPFASPTVDATPAAVLEQVSSLLGKSPLRLEARGGGFPALLPVDWNGVRRLLLVHTGSEADMVMLAPGVAALRSRWPGFALLTSPASAAVAGLFPGVNRLLVADPGSLIGPLAEGATRKLVDQLRAESFDAAIIFTTPDQNPYTTAYICYLAGIPVRIGASKEFGGGLLSHWVRKLPQGLHPEERHLALLRAVALPSSVGNAGLAVPPAVEARIRLELCEMGIDPAHRFVLLDAPAVRWGRPDAFADRLRHMSRMQAVPGVGFRSASAVDWAALVQFSAIVITSDPVTTRLADAFGRPFIATGTAATPSDGWHPRRSFSKFLAGQDVGEEHVLEAIRTLLWLGETRVNEAKPGSAPRASDRTDPTDRTDPSDQTRAAGLSGWLP